MPNSADLDSCDVNGQSGRYRLSRREARQLLQDLWAVRVILGAVVRQEQAQSASLAPIVEEVRAAIQQAAVVNMVETGWWQEQRGQGNPERKVAALCREQTKRWPALDLRVGGRRGADQ